MIRVHLGVGLALLFGVSYFAITKPVHDLAIVEAEKTAEAETRVAVAEGRLGFAHMVERLRSSVELAAAEMDSADSQVEIAPHLEALAKQTGDAGAAAVIDGKGAILGQRGKLNQSALRVVDDARAGTSSARLREVPGGFALGVAAPIGRRGAVLLYDLPIDYAAMSAWSRSPARLMLANVKREVLARHEQVSLEALPELGRYEQAGAQYIVSAVELEDGVSVSAILAASARVDEQSAGSIVGVVKTGVFGLGLLALALVLIVTPLVGGTSLARAETEFFEEDEEPSLPPEPLPSDPPQLRYLSDPPPAADDYESDADYPSDPPYPAEYPSYGGPTVGSGATVPPPALSSGSPHEQLALPSQTGTEPTYVPQYASEITSFGDPLSQPPRSAERRSGFTPTPHAPPSLPVASSSPLTPQPGYRSVPPPGGLVYGAETVPFDLEHYRVVYNEFVGSKQRLGESVENITLEGFSAKLRKSEQNLITKHGCRAVRFQVMVRNRQVSLRPQLVR